MKPLLRRRPRAIPALLGLGLVVSSTLGLTSASLPARATDAPEPSVSITVTPAGDGVLQPRSDLVVTAAMTNTARDAAGAGTLTVTLERDAIETRAELAAWLESGEEPDPDARKSRKVAVTVPTPELQPGEQQLAQATIPAADLARFDEWGVYGLEGSVVAGGGTTTSARSSVVVNVGTAPTAVPVAVAVPLTTQPAQTGLIPAATLASITTDNGLLTRQLNSVIDRPVAVFLDPRIIVSIRALGTTAPPSALDWLERLRAASNPVYPLSYADSDLSAMSQAGLPQLLTPTSFAYALDPANFAGATNDPAQTQAPGSSSTTPDGAGAREQTPTPAPSTDSVPSTESLLNWNYRSSSIAWPRDDTLVSGDLPHFAASGLDTSIVSSSNVTFPEEAAPAGVANTGNNSRALVSDALVSRALREASVSATAAERARSLASLTSSLAVIAHEDAGRGTIVLATLDREAPSEGSALNDALADLGQLPWASPAPFPSYLEQPATPGAAIVDKPQPAERTAQVASLVGSENQLGAFSSVIADPGPLLGETRATLLALLANSWASNSGGWNVAVQTQVGAINASLGGVSIVSGSPINLLSNTGALPVVVENTLPYPVTVTLRLAPSNFKLVVEKEVTVTVEASSSKQAKVPVKAGVANGDTTVRVELISPTGVLVTPTPSYIPVNVSADWEVAGTWLVGGIVAVLLVVAAIRLVRRSRHEKAAGGVVADETTDHEPDAGDRHD